MIKKRTKAIRNFLALLVLLTTGGTQQVWAQTETLSDLDDAQIQLSYDGGTTYNSSDGTVTGVAHENYNSFNWCLMVEIRVNPKAGYITKLSQMTSNWNGDDPYTSFGNVREGDGDPYEGELVFVPYDPADDEASPLYGHYEAKRTILVYSKKKNPNNFAVKISFTYVGIFLQNKLGDNATVTFYEPNADFAPEDDAYVFDPVAYTGNGAEIIAKTPADFIDNSDGNDHYVIAHIVPNPGYWTDRTLLMAYEAGGALARSRAPIVDPAYTLKLLQADTYDDAESNTKSRHDGAGWYYYKLPKEHNCTAGYKYSIINGFAPEIFDLSNQTVTQDVNTNTVTVSRTTDDWTATLTYNKLSLSFDFKIDAQSLPQVQKISIKKGDTEMIAIDDRTTLDALIGHNCNGGAPLRIGENLLGPTIVSSYNCLVGSDLLESKFNITVPFPGKGTETEPWLIQGAEKLSLLAKCVNVGAYDFADKYVKLDNGESYSYDMSAYNDHESEKCFEPIGLTGDIYNTPFCGIFDGNNVTISGINYSFDPGAIVGDLSFVNSIGLFGQIGISAGDPVDCKNGIVKNLRLSDCTFASEYDQACFVGGIAGYIDRGGIYGSTVSSSTVSASGANSHTGAIFGHKNAANVELENNHYTFDTKVSLGSGTSVTTASGYTKRGGFIGTAWDDITDKDGAMMYVKPATIDLTASSGRTLIFDKKTPGTDCYAIDDTKSPAEYSYAPGDNITLTATYKQTVDDCRTFYDQVSISAKDANNNDVAINSNAATLDNDTYTQGFSFTMPEGGAAITATIAPSDWFTIETNQKKWMSFYHVWQTGGNATAGPVNANYTVTDPDGKKTIEALTITGVNLLRGSVTTGDLRGTSFSGMPTLFHCESGLPAKLKFTPYADAYTNVTVYDKFKGTAEDKDMREFTNVYVMNAIGDFYNADIAAADYMLKAHRCYIVLGNTAIVAPARLRITSGDDTGIDAPRTDTGDADARWFTIDGRRMEGRPQKKGIYINGDRKVVIK